MDKLEIPRAEGLCGYINEVTEANPLNHVHNVTRVIRSHEARALVTYVNGLLAENQKLKGEGASSIVGRAYHLGVVATMEHRIAELEAERDRLREHNETFQKLNQELSELVVELRNENAELERLLERRDIHE